MPHGRARRTVPTTRSQTRCRPQSQHGHRARPGGFKHLRTDDTPRRPPAGDGGGIVTGPGRELDPTTCPRLADSGVYLLGALTSPERADYAAHLTGCTDCQSEVDQLAHLPALLNRITVPAPPSGPGVTSPASVTTTGRPPGKQDQVLPADRSARPARTRRHGRTVDPARRGSDPVRR
jgi:hypothetical protein